MPIFKKTKCFMKWCYSPSRHEDGTCDKFCTYNTVYVQTNADRIRSMTDEELTEFIMDVQSDVANYYCGNYSSEPSLPTRKETWLDWLEKEI